MLNEEHSSFVLSHSSFIIHHSSFIISFMRHDGRKPDELRPIKIKRRFTRSAPGSVLMQAGRTTVLCTADVADDVPPWMKGQGRGAGSPPNTACCREALAPASSANAASRVDGRTTEIQRLIGRSLRAVVDLDALGERTVTIDCDVLEADGGTRTSSVTGAFIALVDALHAKKLLPAASPRSGRGRG